jgi:hypothetical protein
MAPVAARNLLSTLPAIDWDRLEVVELTYLDSAAARCFDIGLVAPLLFSKLRQSLRVVLSRLGCHRMAARIPTRLKIGIQMTGIASSTGSLVQDNGDVSTLAFVNGFPIVSTLSFARIQEGNEGSYVLSLDSDEGDLELTAGEANIHWVKVHSDPRENEADRN